MLEILTVILFCWLFFKALGLAFRVAWGTTKILAALLFTVAVPMLVVCLLFAGGIALQMLEKEGIKAGLFRPITLWPFPSAQLKKAASQPTVKAVLDFELSMGQMIDDVKIALEGCRPVSFVGKAGGVVPTPAEVASAAKAAIGR